MDWRTRAEKVTPGGSQTRSKRRLYDTPVALVTAQGARTWDIDGISYLDWISGLCAIGLGHGNPEVDEAVCRQIKDKGVCLSLPSRLEVEVAEQLLDAIKFGEQVRWVKTGSEATGGAMQIARKATNRKAVISVGYHGWHDEHLPGPYLWTCDFGDLERLDLLFRQSNRGIAAVLMEPPRDTEPPQGYLETVQDLCQDHGTLLIMDELVTGFRWAKGGATEFYGLLPDLACYGKALANGYPLGAIVGPAKYMAHADGVSSTFGGECVGLVAAQATLGVYVREPVIQHLWDIGRELVNRLKLHGWPCYPRIADPARVRPLCDQAAERGVLIHPQKGTFCPTFAHSKRDVEDTIKALQTNDQNE